MGPNGVLLPDFDEQAYARCMIDEDAIRYRWDTMGSKLDERGRRLFAAAEVRTAGWGGLAIVSRITGLARSTINRGDDELDAEPLAKGKVRRAGGRASGCRGGLSRPHSRTCAARRTRDPGRSHATADMGLQEHGQTRWHRPSFIGVERVDPSRPTMFVGNHTLYGIQDVPHILYELRRVHGIFPRTFLDRVHFEVPVWRDLLTVFGCVEGTRENCRALIRAGQHLMVFPGGQREVFKRKNEAYRLIWKERIGFVTLAAAFGYPIVPFASLGADESLQSPWTDPTS